MWQWPEQSQSRLITHPGACGAWYDLSVTRRVGFSWELLNCPRISIKCPQVVAQTVADTPPPIFACVLR